MIRDEPQHETRQDLFHYTADMNINFPRNPDFQFIPSAIIETNLSKIQV